MGAGGDHGTSVNQMLELKDKPGQHPDIHFTGLNNSDAKPATVRDFDETADHVLPPLAEEVRSRITSETGCSMLTLEQ